MERPAYRPEEEEGEGDEGEKHELPLVEHGRGFPFRKTTPPPGAMNRAPTEGSSRLVSGGLGDGAGVAGHAGVEGRPFAVDLGEEVEVVLGRR